MKPRLLAVGLLVAVGLAVGFSRDESGPAPPACTAGASSVVYGGEPTATSYPEGCR